MKKHQIKELLMQVYHEYQTIKIPKYRNANLVDLKGYLDTLNDLKGYLKDDRIYNDLVNGISQTINRIEKSTKTADTWRNISERGINKAIQPVAKKSGQSTEFPFEWKYPNSNLSCCISDYWGARNFMVMDMIGYIFLLAQGGGVLPKETSFVFNGLSSIETRELLLSTQSTDNDQQMPFDIEERIKPKYGVRFTDADFRRCTSLNYKYNQIRDLLDETSKVEFKLIFPVRILEGGEFKENLYQMSTSSKLFNIKHIDHSTRDGGVVNSREHHVFFNTILGELFVHNLLSGHYDWVDSNFYVLPSNAQAFYRQFIIHNDLQAGSIYLSTIKERLHLSDKNQTNLINTIEENIFKPLIQHGLITSAELDPKKGFNGRKFNITRPKKGKRKQVNS